MATDQYYQISNSTDSTWPTWISNNAYAATSAHAYFAHQNNNTWGQWVSAGTTSSADTITIPYQRVWNEWVASGTVNVGIDASSTDASWNSWVYAQAETEDEKRLRAAQEVGAKPRWDAQQRVLAEAAAKREEEQRLADARAKELLKGALVQAQLERFERDECIPVDTAKGNKYLIRKGRTKNIDVLNPDGTVKHRLCVHPASDCPDFDTMLAQKLWLEHSEDEILRMANVWPA